MLKNSGIQHPCGLEDQEIAAPDWQQASCSTQCLPRNLSRNAECAAALLTEMSNVDLHSDLDAWSAHRLDGVASGIRPLAY
eukprot:CAMPEP_0115365684 /NCGR_PEP_ID=MMETSP0270-20121206/104412_1 /TAXON_ID=71861 /ORGANISM="Scrippsiella trochoidea, Strain CCMP3099" /LENGTH=80 /DNA_ID=CAMNT_0002788423 /DNA_START=171 /DNA_END=413 /DNA_ORIENTATION=+